MKKIPDLQLSVLKYQWQGILFLSSAPGRCDMWSMEKRNLQQDLKQIKQQNIHLIVCLLEQDQMKKLGIKNYPEECEKLLLQFLHFSMEDMEVPCSADLEKFKEMVAFVEKKLNDGKNVLGHCQSGNGRTGMFSAALLMKKGHPAEKAIEKIREQENMLQSLISK